MESRHWFSLDLARSFRSSNYSRSTKEFEIRMRVSCRADKSSVKEKIPKRSACDILQVEAAGVFLRPRFLSADSLDLRVLNIDAFKSESASTDA